MRERRESEGLGVVRRDLVGRYVAAGSGPPPRMPLRFWIGGEWLELSAPDPEPTPMPVYRWVLAPVADEKPIRRRAFATASGSGRPIGRRPSL